VARAGNTIATEVRILWALLGEADDEPDVTIRTCAPHTLCGPPFFAKRSMYLSGCYADSGEAAAVTPEHLLHGVLRDLQDPYGAQLGRRGCKHLIQLGWTVRPINPANALLQAHDVDTIRLRSELGRVS